MKKKNPKRGNSRDPIPCKLIANERIINQVMNFYCLGVETSSNRSLTNKVQKQIKKAARISEYVEEQIHEYRK